MNNQRYFDMIRAMKSVSFATVNNEGHPKVRIIDVMFVENERLYFVTARGKEFYEELIDREEVAITGINKNWQTIRLSGKVKKLEQNLLKRVFDENQEMNNVYPGESRYILDVFCLYEGEGERFDLGKTPIEREYFAFGKTDFKLKGFEIIDKCIGCGNCERNCPQKCIHKGTPFEIQQKNCLHCGLCKEKCPVKAIRVR